MSKCKAPSPIGYNGKIRIIFLVFLLSVADFVLCKNLGPLPEVLKPSMIDIFQDKLYVVDSSAIYIYFIKNMRFLTKFGKIGEGPGEFKVIPQLPLPVRVKAFSDFILVESIDKILYFSREGKFQKEKRKSFQQTRFFPIGENFVARKTIQDQIKMPSYSVLSVYNSELEEIKEIYRQRFTQQGLYPEIRLDMSQDFIIFQVFDNKIFVEESAKGFLIEVFDYKGQKLYQIEKKYEKIKVTDEDKNNIIENFKNDPHIQLQAKQLGGWDELKKTIKFDFPDFFPPIQNFEISNNKIYIQTFKTRDKKEEYIIMDMKGNIQKTMFIPGFKKTSVMSKLLGVKLSTIKNDKIYYLEENEEEEWELHVEEIK